jgi:hypothetical protein
MSCCANLGFNGYYNVFKFMAQRDPDLKYMVLHITPYTMPRPEMWESDGANLWGAPGLEVFGDTINREYISAWRLLSPPSMAYRRQVSYVVYNAPTQHGKGPEDRAFTPGDPIVVSSDEDGPYYQFLRTYRQSGGWTPETDVRGGVYAAECDMPTLDYFDFRTMSRRTYIDSVFSSFAALAKRYHAKLVIVFQPVGCVLGTGTANAKAREAVERFKGEHPEVEFPFPLIETWPVDVFSVPAHVRREYTDRIGDRLGEAMAEIIKKHNAAPTD